MALYRIKLCDHTGSPAPFNQQIQILLQGYFNRVFATTRDMATVTWGAGSSADTIVLHFAADIARSYIRRALSGTAKINPLAGGHTTSHLGKLCSEFYSARATKGGKMRAQMALDCAQVAFHESLHNVLPSWGENQLMGHGGLADTPIGPDLNQWDIDTMRKGIATRSVYTQQF